MQRNRSSFFLPATISCFIGLASWNSDLNAADKNARMAITDVSVAGEDFLIQGEYQGWIQKTSGGTCQIGLQVRSLGDGEFSAVEYPGGLPGTGWSMLKKFELSGTREESAVWLASQDCLFIVDGRKAKAIAPDGHSLGALAKIQRQSPTLGWRPPNGARVLYGPGVNEFKNGKITEQGWLKWGTETMEAFGDFDMHLEFRLPYMPYARGQGRANSGLYIQSRYEVQILDSFALEGVENECGALYKTQRPEINMCLPPLQWQTYDVKFRSPRFLADGETKRCDARITVLHNGVAIHRNRLIPSKTGAGKKEGSLPLPTKLQDHGNPVVFRNIWLIDRRPTTSMASQAFDG